MKELESTKESNGTSPDCGKPVVSGSSFVEAIREIEPIAWQMWADKRGWFLPGKCKYALEVWIYDGFAYVNPQGYGSCQSLKAKTAEELKECCEMWWRNR